MLSLCSRKNDCISERVSLSQLTYETREGYYWDSRFTGCGGFRELVPRSLNPSQPVNPSNLTSFLRQAIMTLSHLHSVHSQETIFHLLDNCIGTDSPTGQYQHRHSYSVERIIPTQNS
jgi:hypothetical protein